MTIWLNINGNIVHIICVKYCCTIMILYYLTRIMQFSTILYNVSLPMLYTTDNISQYLLMLYLSLNIVHYIVMVQIADEVEVTANVTVTTGLSSRKFRTGND